MTLKSNDSASNAERHRFDWKRRGAGNTGALVRAAFLAAIAIATLAAPRAAFARKRVVVLEFHGHGASRIRREVAHIVHRRAELVSASRFHRAARRLHARRPTAHNVARIARRLSVNGVVVGLIRRHHHRYRLIVVLRDGRHGRIVKRVVLTLRHPRLSRHDRRVIAQRLDRGIARLPSVGHAREESADNGDEGDDMGGSDNQGADNADNGSDNGSGSGDNDMPPGLNSKQQSDDDSGQHSDDKQSDDKQSDDDSHSDTSASVTAKAATKGAGHRAAEVSAGIDFVNRSLTFTSVAGLMNRPQNYQGGTVPAALVSAEIYPLALGKPSKSWTHNIGVTAVVDKVLSISSHLQGMTQALPTSQTRWGIGLVYRWAFGDSPTSATLKIGAGYNNLSFTIDKSKSSVTVDVPNVSYTYFDPGATIRYPVNAKFALIGDARFLAITATGEVQKASQYGAAKMTGFHLQVGAEYQLKPRLLLQAGGRWTGISYSFNGNGDLTVNRDGNPSTQDVLGASDRYLAGYVTVGYMF